ncbi:MAG: ribosome biogenesis GTPase Der [Kiloniellales bacterium]|nr:ribosome biogenesis GTPase Der [Kiloniellales bacterium]
MPFTVAILGRPNVGKSTLFNRLVGRRLALVDDEPGVTRDRREGEARLYDLKFRVFDTAGLEEAFDDSLEARMRTQTERALSDSDLALLLIDARAGLTPLDEHFANWLRRAATPVVLVANKCEGGAGEPGLLEAYRLGLGDPVPFSAEHGLGLSDLHDAIRDHIAEPDEDVDPDSALSEEETGGPLQLAVVGRPNVGKSTLINRLIGEERLLTGPEAGITRDSIAVEWVHKGRKLRLIDTAGMRRRARVTAKLEKLSVADGLRALRFAHVVVLLVDADDPLEKQDLTIARMVVEEGRGLVIGVNKWDACADRQATLAKVRDRLARSLPQSKGVPVVTLSALQGRNLDRLLDAVFALYDVWNRRVPTSDLNRWLEAVTESHPPPVAQGRRVRLKYITQARTRPPTFAISCSRPDALPGSYLRYLENALREDFDLPGTPIRIHLKKGENPYAKRGRGARR